MTTKLCFRNAIGHKRNFGIDCPVWQIYTLRMKNALLVSLLTTTVTLTAAVASLPLEIATAQHDCPILLNSATSTTEFLFDSIAITNRTDRAIRSVILAVSFSDDLSSGKATSVRLPQQSVRLAGRGKTTLGGVGISADDVIRTANSSNLAKPRAMIGAVEVVFVDGDVWSYDLDRQQHRFPTQSSRVASGGPKDSSAGCTNQYLANSSDELGTALRAVFQFGYFSCDGTTSCIYCTNSGASCTVNQCNIAQGVCTQCALQTCSWHP